MDSGVILVRSGAVRGPGVRALRGGGTRCFGRGALCHEGGGVGVGDGEGALRCALLPPGLGWLGLNVIEDVLGGSGLRCRRGAGLGLGLGFGCGLSRRRRRGTWGTAEGPGLRGRA